jgi:thermitase
MKQGQSTSAVGLRGFLRALLALTALSALPFAAAGNDIPQEGPPALSDQILVKPQKDLPETAWRALENAHGLRQQGDIPAIGVRIMKVPAERRETVLEALSRNPNIEFAEPDFTVSALLTPNDPRYPNQWHLPRISAPKAWDTTTGRADQVIAIIDTGVNSNHPDLRGKMLPGYNFIGNNTNSSDDNGHGTLVAGAAAAIGNNAEGVAGVAFLNWILPVKALDSAGSGSHSSIANGITWAADNGARIINLSLGSSSSSRTLENAVNYAASKGALLIAAAGNTGANERMFPAAYSDVIGVSALDSNDRLPSWATFGTHVALSAPGVNILSTTRAGGYGTSSGSSFASPLVAGAAGLVLAVNPALSRSEVTEILQSTARDLGAAGYDIYYGHGRVDAAAAVAKAKAASTKDTTPPAVTIVSPSSGSTVSGTVDIQVDSYDDVGVQKVELYINDKLVGSTSHQVVTFRWDTSQWQDGDYTLQARAYDAAGNIGASKVVSVTLANTPPETTPQPPADPLTVAITSPADGSRVDKMTKIDVATTGGTTISRIELYINGSLHGTASSSPATFNWNVNRLPAGEYKLQAFARDSAGNVAESTVVTLRK